MGVEVALASVGMILLLGFLGELVFRKTNVPSVLWLLALGLLLGPVFGVANPQQFIGIVELFAAVAIAIIVFEGGLGMDMYSMFSEAKSSVALTLAAFFLSAVAAASVMFIAGYSVINSLLMGVVVGGTNSAIVMSGISRIAGTSKAAKALISLETAINDVLVIIMFIVISQLALAGSADLLTAARTLVGQFSIGAIIGILVGLAWLPLYHRLARIEFSYVVTLSLLFLLYSGVELMQGNGALAALLFGVVLGNARQVLRTFKIQKPFALDQTTRHFHSFISFITRTFFFVYIGIIVSIKDYRALAIGGAIALALLAARAVAVRVSTHRNRDLTPFDRSIMTIMLPRGLTAAVLAYLPASRGVAGTEAFADIVFTVIVVTVIIYTIGMLAIERKSKRKQAVGA
ncbi:cation:proton antiporter [Candidatus Micrarchaeota archaeon]|nr:cation:proton antiporter [Candidatus Micrarchaeota archaeon]